MQKKTVRVRYPVPAWAIVDIEVTEEQAREYAGYEPDEEIDESMFMDFAIDHFNDHFEGIQRVVGGAYQLKNARDPRQQFEVADVDFDSEPEVEIVKGE